MIVGVGTVALDTVETPAGRVDEVPGGSALYFAAAASARAPVAVVGVTGDDFPEEPLRRLAARGVDVSGIVRRPHPTFRWRARYDADGGREILSAHRGGIVREVPVVPAALRDPAVLFLGSTDPGVQTRVLDQAGAPGCVVMDTMAHWIRDRRPSLEALLARVDVLLGSADEVCLLGGAGADAAAGAGESEHAAAQAVRALGPTWVVAKRGARGACAYGPGARLEVEAAPLERVVDPTGAGDAFAGGLVASLAASPDLGDEAMRDALGAGVVMGARAVSAFSFEGLLEA